VAVRSLRPDKTCAACRSARILSHFDKAFSPERRRRVNTNGFLDNECRINGHLSLHRHTIENRINLQAHILRLSLDAWQAINNSDLRPESIVGLTPIPETVERYSCQLPQPLLR
jgi:hypothetical protein